MSTISTGTIATTAFVVTGDTSGELVIKTGPGAGTTALTIDAAQNVAFTNAPAIPATISINGVLYAWPAADGAADSFLKTNGTGTLTWAAPAGLPPVTVTASTSVSAVAGNHYVLTAATAATVTLPTSPVISDTVWITVANGRVDNVVARNGQNIQGLAENMTLNAPYAAAQLRFSDATEGWVMI